MDHLLHGNYLFDAELKSSTFKTRRRVIKDYFDGLCCACSGIPAKMVVYDVGDGSSLLDFYCDPCYHKHKHELKNRLQNMDFA